jgi:Secretion system C-terminal sorting domain
MIRIFFSFIIILFSLNIALSQNWEKVSGVYPNVHQLFFPSTDSKMVIAASDSGVADMKAKDPFKYFNYFTGNGLVVSNDYGVSFTPNNSFNTFVVTAISEMPNNPNEWILAYSDVGTRRIAYSTDKGKTWDRESSACDGIDEFSKFTVSGENIFAGSEGNSSGIYSFVDDFGSCNNESSPQISVRDLKSVGDIIVASGGQGVALSQNGGQDWTFDNSGIDNLRIQTVDYSEEGDGVVLCGGDYYNISGQSPSFEGRGIFLSTDFGQSWSQRGLSGEFVYDIKHHPRYPLFMAAACGYAGVWISADGGLSWNAYNDGLSDIIVPEGIIPDTIPDVRLIEIPDWEREGGEEGDFVVFAGVYNYGLFKSKGINPTLVGIDDERKEKFSIYPNPAKEFVGISSYFGIKSNIKIYSSQGIEILNDEAQGSNRIDYKRINLPENLESGVYFIEIESDKGRIYNKFIVR